ncbi:UNVERIFIED_CONTAM: hypothetical protein FKN15_029128 [Acipenser sinensis]
MRLLLNRIIGANWEQPHPIEGAPRAPLGRGGLNDNLTLYTDSPDLTPCFQNTVLAWIPCIFLWAAFPFYYFYLKQNNKGYIVMSILNKVKTFFGVLLWLICWLDLFYELGKSRVQHPVNIVTPLILGITMLLATVLIQYERLRGVQSSGLLFIFWLLALLCAIVPFRSRILEAIDKGVTDQLRFTTFYIYFGLLLFQLILSCFNEKPPLFSSIVTDPNPCPESTAGFLSTMTFWWFTSMAIKGYRNPLEDKDLWSLNKKDTSEIVVPMLLKNWETEKAKVQRKNQAVYTSSNKVVNHVDGGTEEARVLLLGKNDTKQPSFLKALLKAYGSYFLIGSAYKLMQDLISFVNPQLLNLLINFTMQKDAPSWWGFALAFLMFFCALLQTIILHQHFQYCFVTGMRLRTAIIGAIYRKSLVITTSAKRSSTVGEIVNLMSVDAQRFMDLTTFLNMLCLLINFTMQKDAPSWWGFTLAFLMFFCALLQTIILHQHFQYCFVTGMRLRTSIIGAIYRKSLVITTSAKRSSTVGEIVNLMSVDAQRFMDLTTFLNMLWSAPLQIILALYFLWQYLGPSVLAGVAVMVLLIPLNAAIAMKTRAFQPTEGAVVRGLDTADSKPEPRGYQHSAPTAAKPVSTGLRPTLGYAYALGLARVPRLSYTSPRVALTTFAVYVTVDEKNILDAKKAFVSLSLFNILRFPLNMLPQVISSLVQASVSLKRIQSFLSHDELDPDSVDKKNIASGRHLFNSFN